jgi:hypothetical protein
MRPVTIGDLLSAARVLLAHADGDWPDVLQGLLDEADRADRLRRYAKPGGPMGGNGTLMSAALGRNPPPAPPPGNRRYLAAIAAVAAGLLARPDSLERLEGHGGQRAADAGNVEQPL